MCEASFFLTLVKTFERIILFKLTIIPLLVCNVLHFDYAGYQVLKIL